MNTEERKRKRAEYDKRRRMKMTSAQRLEESERLKRLRTSSTPQQKQSRNNTHKRYRRRQLEINSNFRTEEWLRQRRIPPPTDRIARIPGIRPKLHELGQKNASCTECDTLLKKKPSEVH